MLSPETMSMNEFAFDVRFIRNERVTADLERLATQAEAELWASADALRERVYADVQVEIDWTPLLERKRTARLHPRVLGNIDERDAAAYVELFFHDAFLVFNLAVPGSFSGTLTGRGLNAIRLDAKIFEYAWVTAARNDWPLIDVLPLRDVIAWYDRAGIGTTQLATTAAAKALLHLLHLARIEEDEHTSVLRLSQSLEALYGDRTPTLPPRIFELRDAVARGTAPVVHPMHDDALDARVDAIALDFIDAADLAASLVVGELQAQVRRAIAALR